MSNQINTQEVIKKEFLNIFEISHLFNVSGITARRHIKTILDKIDLLEDKLKLCPPNDKPPILQELNALVGKARKRVIGQTQGGESMYVLEISNKEAFENWDLRPNIKTIVKDAENLITQESAKNDNLSNHEDTQDPDLSTQNPNQDADYDNASVIQEPKVSTQNAAPDDNQSEINGLGEKYVKLLESQLLEKDATIKDLRETNKFLSITNGKLNEQLRLLLEKPPDPAS